MQQQGQPQPTNNIYFNNVTAQNGNGETTNITVPEPAQVTVPAPAPAQNPTLEPEAVPEQSQEAEAEPLQETNTGDATNKIDEAAFAGTKAPDDKAEQFGDNRNVFVQ